MSNNSCKRKKTNIVPKPTTNTDILEKSKYFEDGTKTKQAT